MVLFFHGVCLLITLFVLQSYVITGFHAREHRLLPLLLGLIGLYNFYRIVQDIMGVSRAVVLLIDLLIIQMVYLLFHYVMDFMRIKLNLWVEITLFISLMITNTLVILHVKMGKPYQEVFVLSVAVYVLLLLGVATYARLKTSISKMEEHVDNMLYAAIALPGMALLVCAFSRQAEAIVMPVALETTCLIVYYLMMTGQMTNITITMQENFYNTADIGCFLFDSQMHYRDANMRARELFEDVVEGLEKQPDSYFFYEEMECWGQAPEVEHECQRGEEYYKCHLQPVFYKKRLQGYILSILNITHQRQEIKLMENQSQLKSKFLASVSHELRSPLHAIIGGSEILLRQKGMPAEKTVLLEYIRSAGNTLLTQVNEILAYSKLEAGMLTLEEEEYDFYELLLEQARICLLNLKDKPVEFRIEMETDFPKKMIGDAKRVRQIIQNLLSNASKYTSRGSIVLSIRCSTEKDSGKVCLHVCVADTGVGMSEDTAKSAFGEYVSYSDNMGIEGTGLGLSLVKQLVELMGGWIRTESKEDCGTQFSFEIKQQSVEAEQMPPMQIGSEILRTRQDITVNEVKPNYIYPKARILLVDDMEVNRVIFEELAAPWKMKIDVATCGEEAVEQVKCRDYQMIILDQMMPGMSGFETADEISKFSNAPLVLMTADISDDIRARSVKHGFIDFMAKPVRLERLRRILETCLPVSYRERPLPETDAERCIRTQREAVAYGRTLESYCREVQELQEVLEEFAKTDLGLFQTKVHGIKGISRQIGRDDMAEYAEIMEMAAKTDNRIFIERNLKKFLNLLKQTREEVAAEEKDIRKRYPASQELTVSLTVDDEERKELWEALKEGFDAYDLEQIEKNLQTLSEIDLPAEEAQRLPIVKEAYENLDYEIGSANCGI